LTFSGNGFKPNILIYSGTVANMGSAKLIADVDASEFPTFKVVVPAGSYFFTLTSENASGGSYSVGTTMGASTDGCSNILFTMPGVTFTGTITPNDCMGLSQARFDGFNLTITSGQTINVSGTTNKGGAIALRLSGNTTAADLVSRPINNVAGGSATFSYTATSTNIYFVSMFGEPGITGPANYTLSIN
jgi:hypothetical protein